MNKILSIGSLVAFFLVFSSVYAHDSHYNNIVLRNWSIKSENILVEGSFYLYKNGEVFIEDANHQIVHFPYSCFSEKDQEYIRQKNNFIAEINEQIHIHKSEFPFPTFSFTAKHLISLILFLFLVILLLKWTERKRLKFIIPVFLGIFLTALYSFTGKMYSPLLSPTNPETIDSAFTPFKPNVITHWDTDYFYVESYGIPTTHQMMVGISNHGWQQQVPIPQCYTGTNAWPIPLNPVMATNPIPVDSIRFTRGAIAIAANGIPIFNVHTNTGVDSYLDGQLDNFGGHCGRADDYHYHIAPLHLYNFTTTNLPIAYGLDGFAVYGSLEPDGNTMQQLDANHGHAYGGVYHYHGTTSSPYMIARMAGDVAEDNTHQLIPQAAAHPVRPSRPPLNGALITDCHSNQLNNGFSITYTLGTTVDSILYSWSDNGNYNFKYYTQGNGISLDTIYHGFVPCYSVPAAINYSSKGHKDFHIYPNPSSSEFYLTFNHVSDYNQVQNIKVYNLNGEVVYQSNEYLGKINLANATKGIYLVKIDFAFGNATERIVVE